MSSVHDDIIFTENDIICNPAVMYTVHCIGIGTREAPGACPSPKFSYKLLTTLCEVSDCAPQSKSLSYASAYRGTN